MQQLEMKVIDIVHAVDNDLLMAKEENSDPDTIEKYEKNLIQVKGKLRYVADEAEALLKKRINFFVVELEELLMKVCVIKEKHFFDKYIFIDHLEQLVVMPEHLHLCPIFKDSARVDLSKSEAEYVVNCIKHFYSLFYFLNKSY
jgi:hypothetical protein